MDGSTFLRYRHGCVDVEFHTAVAVADSTSPEHIAMSCTYFVASRLSLAVLYGCASDDVRRVNQLLKKSPEVASHPLLMAGIFAELALSRWENDLIKHVMPKFVVNDTEFSSASSRPSMVRDLNGRLYNAIVRASAFGEELVVGKAAFKEMANRIDEQKVVWEKWEGRDSAREQDPVVVADRFKERFGEICMRMDRLIIGCRAVADNQAHARNFVSQSPTYPTKSCQKSELTVYRYPCS